MIELEYLTDTKGRPKAVVIPIEIWERLLIRDTFSDDDLVDALEDYALGRAMDEAANSPILNRDEALAFLEA